MNPIERERIEVQFHEKILWTRFCNLFLGLWLLAAPATFGYRSLVLAVSDWISGLFLIGFGLISMRFRWRGWIWGGCLVGIWLQFAPLLFWAEEPAIYVNDTLVGVLAIAFCVLVPLKAPQLELGPQIPPGWTYNPSSWHQRIPITLFAIIGWFVARYMAAFQLHYTESVWDPFFGMGTEKVITSMISQNFPVSDAGLGALAYSLEAIMALKGGVRRWHTMPWIVIVFGILVVPVGLVSITLIMLQPIAVGAWCGLCLFIAACMLIMVALTVDEVVASCQYIRQALCEGKSFWRTLFLGSTYAEEGVDTRVPFFHGDLRRQAEGMFWGITFPWNLLLTALLGIWILFSSTFFSFSGRVADNQDVCGALIVVLSLISLAEVIRAARWINMAIALWLALAPWLLSGSTSLLMWHNCSLAVLLFILTPFRGKVKEKYGSWQHYIF